MIKVKLLGSERNYKHVRFVNGPPLDTIAIFSIKSNELPISINYTMFSTFEVKYNVAWHALRTLTDLRHLLQ